MKRYFSRFFLSIGMLTLVAGSLAGCGGSTAPAATATIATIQLPGTVLLPTAAMQPTLTSQPAAASTVGTGGAVQTTPGATAVGDAHITVQHILIGFKDAVGFQGKPPGKAATRTQADAKKLAYDLLAQVKGGGDFTQLMQQYSDDTGPGIYSLANTGATPTSDTEYPRGQMVPAFGNVGFSLQMGEIGIADYDPTTSPFGYHIIKRVPTPPPPTKQPGQDDHITVEHILIGFKDAVGFQGSAPGNAATRTQDAAKKLAYDLLAQVKAGADFGTLMKANSDDTGPGTYSLANTGVSADTATGEYNRSKMVPAFGDVGFTLKVGEVGIADYDPTVSPYGYHIIKRIK